VTTLEGEIMLFKFLGIFNYKLIDINHSYASIKNLKYERTNGVGCLVIRQQNYMVLEVLEKTQVLMFFKFYP